MGDRFWENYGKVRASQSGMWTSKIQAEIKNTMSRLHKMTGSPDFGRSDMWAEKLTKDDYTIVEVKEAAERIIDTYTKKMGFPYYNDFKATIRTGNQEAMPSKDEEYEKAKMYTEHWTIQYEKFCEKYGKEKIEKAFADWFEKTVAVDTSVFGAHISIYKPLFMEHYSKCEGDYNKTIEYTKKFLTEVN